MRFVRIIEGLFIIFILLPTALGQGVTIMQLRDFLLAQHKSRKSDAETADRLSAVTLSERLTEQALSRIITETLPGPDSVEQLRLLNSPIQCNTIFGRECLLPDPSGVLSNRRVCRIAEKSGR